MIELDSGRIPDSLANLLRELKLFDVEVTAKFTPGADSTPNLVLMLSRHDQPVDLAAVQAHSGVGLLTAAVQINDSQLTLRSVSQRGITAVCQRPFDARRFACLLQSCRL